MAGSLGAVSRPLETAEGLRPYGRQEGRRYPWEVGFGSGLGKAAAEVSWAVRSWRCRGAFPRERLRGAPGLWTCLGDTGMEGPLMPCEQMSYCQRHAQGPKLQERADECIHGGR